MSQRCICKHFKSSFKNVHVKKLQCQSIKKTSKVVWMAIASSLLVALDMHIDFDDFSIITKE